ncbi:hypothetical protein [Roseicella aerolata]|uniref:Uncharacterized protein n=1 Tax=Roseicella aerolata TaxID=2883479 RepID=A0A9X1IAM5_9PROT|nr:hypothetical protein [Roseicella aerolata]MCB4820907.1 hypothetical protein [Roseicella aerolata]
MSNGTIPKPTRSGEAPDDPGRAAPDQPSERQAGTDGAAPADPADARPTRRDRSGIDHPRDTEDSGPDLTGAGAT